MATAAVKTTYSLDVETVETLARVARAWNVSKSEALRRAIRAAAESGSNADVDEKLAAWRELQRSVALTPAKGDAWLREVRAERRASSTAPDRKRRK